MCSIVLERKAKEEKDQQRSLIRKYLTLFDQWVRKRFWRRLNVIPRSPYKFEFSCQRLGIVQVLFRNVLSEGVREICIYTCVY